MICGSEKGYHEIAMSMWSARIRPQIWCFSHHVSENPKCRIHPWGLKWDRFPARRSSGAVSKSSIPVKKVVSIQFQFLLRSIFADNPPCFVVFPWRGWFHLYFFLHSSPPLLGISCITYHHIPTRIPGVGPWMTLSIHFIWRIFDCQQPTFIVRFSHCGAWCLFDFDDPSISFGASAWRLMKSSRKCWYKNNKLVGISQDTMGITNMIKWWLDDISVRIWRRNWLPIETRKVIHCYGSNLGYPKMDGRHGPYLMGDEKKLELSQQQRQSHQQLGTLPRKIVVQQGWTRLHDSIAA